MGFGNILGTLIGAGGQIGGGLLAAQGGLNSGDMINANVNTALDPYLTGFSNDAAALIGRDDVNREPDPWQQIVGQIERLPLDEKTKRRALIELGDRAAGRPERYGGVYTEAAISRLGLTGEDLTRTLQQTQEFQARQDRLSGQSQGLNERIYLDRLNAAAEASSQLGAAAGFAAGGTPVNELQRNLKARDDQQLADLRDSLLTNANFGNLNPGAAYKTIADQELSQDLRLIEQSLAVSQGLTGAFGAGNAVAGGGATANASAVQGAAQIAAQQAQATNALRNSTSIDNALSLGQGIAGAANTLNNGLLLSGGGGGSGGSGGFSLSSIFGGGGSNSLNSSGGDGGYTGLLDR